MENVYRYYPQYGECESQGVPFNFSDDFLRGMKEREELYQIFGIKFISHSGLTYHVIKERFEKGVFYYFESSKIKSLDRHINGYFKVSNN